MRIVHVSDIHIRTLRYHDEYRAAFNDLYRKVAELSPDLIVNTGDTVHAKTVLTPELVSLAREHFEAMANIAPHIVILGNHDLNLRNPDRLDAISPVIAGMEARNEIELLTKSGFSGWTNTDDAPRPPIKFWTYAISDPTGEHFAVDPADINVGLFHGSVAGCQTDQGFVLEEAECGIERFSGMDFVLMGDIHKRQSFRDGRMWYAGSLIQQNFGEDEEKGFLLWDIRGRDDWDVSFHRVEGARGFRTIQVPASLELPELDGVDGSRVRLVVDAELTLAEQKGLEVRARSKYQPFDIVSITSKEGADYSAVKMSGADVRDVGCQAELIREFLRERGAQEDVISAVVELNNRLQEQTSEGERTSTDWRLRRLHWDNMFNYGEGNVLDLTKLRGVVGIFAPNTSGKSSIFEVMLQTLFDKVSKDVPRNIDLVNDNREVGSMSAELSVGDGGYLINRKIERIKHGQKKYSEAREWGKTTLDLYQTDEECLNGDTRPETERVIRNLIGSFDDFVMTSMVAQRTIAGVPGGADIINCKETDRKKILYRYLDLDSFERKLAASKEELNDIRSELRLVPESVEDDLSQLRTGLGEHHGKIDGLVHEIALLERDLLDRREEWTKMSSVEVRDFVDPTEILQSIREVDGELSRMRGENWEHQDRRLRILLALGVVEDQTPSLPDVNLQQVAEALERVTKSSASALSEKKENTSRLKRGQAGLKLLGTVPCKGEFPECQFLVDAARDGAAVPSLGDALREIDERLVGFLTEEGRLRDLLVVHRDIEECRAERRRLETELIETDAKIETLLTRIESIEGRLLRKTQELKDAEETNNFRIEALAQRKAAQDVGSQVTQMETRLAIRRSELLEAQRQLGVGEARLATLEAHAHRSFELGGKAQVHELYAQAVGKDGIPYRILTSMLPAINEQINRILGNVVDFRVFLEHDPVEGTIALYLQYRDYRSRPLGLGSGAEKFISSLAIRSALLNVSCLPKTNFMVIDEGFGQLDPEHLEALQRMFHYLRTVFETVFVVSHVDVMKDLVDQNIEISVGQDGYAKVRVE